MTSLDSSWPLVLPVFAFLSCAGSPNRPTTYQDGPMIRPPPAPAARSGVGAPVVGQPGVFELRDYPRSPYGRVLPEDEHTRTAPGLWQAENPRASAEDATNPLTWGQFFFPEDLDGLQALEGQDCYRQKSETQKWRFTIKAYQHCVTEKNKTRDALIRKTLAVNRPGNLPRKLNDLKRTADLLEQARCLDDLPQETERFLNLVKQKIDEALRGGQGN